MEWDAVTSTAILDLDHQVQSSVEHIDGEGGITGSFLPTGCISWGSLSFRNGVSGGKAIVRVYCTPNKYRNISITVHLQARSLRSGAVYQEVDSKSDGCTRVLSRCSVTLPFTAISDRAKLYRATSDITVTGQPRIRVSGPDPWVFSASGKPYPEVWWPPLGYVPFPNHDGPWWPSNSDSRRQTRFNNQCDAFYAANGWALDPLYEGQYEHHHIHPLEFGGDDNGYTNCVILPRFLHQEFTDWWNDFSF